MQYSNKFVNDNRPEVTFPDGLRDDTKNTFSITYTDQHSMNYDQFAETTKDIILKELVDLKEDGSFRLNMKYFNYATGLTMTNDNFSQLFGQKVRNP